ncbi:FAD-dependent oxidoreductase [Pseudoalteromonas porphyrae]|uniref:FAD-dependent oxidoreductase n=1 Tax=Pseudoalteromonas porphyrae TaxID=187330 RepID=UPI0006C84D06|nr:FAD-binding oxidoreductase [Pseudoalteromonas porphyrae]
MDRRQFMGFSAASFFLTACGGSSNSKQAPVIGIQPVTPPVESVLTKSQWEELKSSLDGQLILPTDNSTYPTARLVFNTRYDHIYPQAIAHCANEQDVITALSFTEQHSMHVTSRCGSHSYIGNSTTQGLVIDVTPMDSISITANTATIGAGARLADVYDKLTENNVAVALGSCLSVGIAGLTLGGGFGVVGRAYGLTCDSLVAVDIISAQGEKLTCDKNQHSDLFWALRGGGGGNFGVVTSFTFKTHATSDITVFEANFSFADFEKVMASWQALPDLWPDEMWGQFLPDWSNGTSRVNVRAFCVNSATDATPYWQDFMHSIDATPSSNTVTTAPYRDVMLGTCSASATACHLATQFEGGRMSRSAFAASSDFFDKEIPPAGINTLKEYIEKSIVEGNRGMIIFNLMGGKISQFEPNETAFFHRNARVSAEYYTALPLSASDNTIDVAQKWENSFRQIMSPWSSGGAYVNYLDPLINDPQSAYFGENLLKLKQVKLQYDPNWLFKSSQGIAPA